jgi:hypothetical protein
MIVNWSEIGEHREQQPTTKAQRRALYRLGLSRGYVHRHVKTQEQVTVAMEIMATLNTRLRGGRENSKPSG